MEINAKTVNEWLDKEIAKWTAADAGTVGEFYADAYRVMKRDLLGDQLAAQQLEMNDDDLMPFGKHKGVRMNDVPDDYLDWVYKQDWIEKWPKLLAYIEKVKDGKSTAAPDRPDGPSAPPVIPPPPPMPQSEHNTSVAERAIQIAKEKQAEKEAPAIQPEIVEEEF